MSVESYCFGAIAIVSGIISVIAFSFYRMGFVGIGPLCLALILLAAGVIGAIVCAKDKKNPKKAKKAKKAKKSKKGNEPAEAEAE
ncbi:MAG: hypothetical protein IJI67_08305 [Clostridia bacterium]|nr:hypothetical protein [Clostridia bacterium]